MSGRVVVVKRIGEGKLEAPVTRPLLRGLVVALVGFCACKPPGLGSTEEFARRYALEHPDRIGDLQTPEHKIHYVTGGTRGAPKVLFVHGSPGSWQSLAHFLGDEALRTRAFIIVADRPGFGGSDGGTAEPSLGSQARSLAALLDLDDPNQAAVLVGHSYGGAVVVKMAAAGDPRVRGIVIAAGSVDPALEKKKFIQSLADLRAVRWVLPSALDVCNQEIEGLQAELNAMLPDWASVKAHVTVLQGLEDELVAPANADFIARMLPANPPVIRRVPKLDHFIPWARPDLIRVAVVEGLDSLGRSQ